MYNKHLYFLLCVLMMPLVSLAQEREEDDSGPTKRAEWDRKLTQDPKTGEIPRQELENARTRMNSWFRFVKQSRLQVAIPNIKWTERGPNNIGGRTRALLWDPNDPDKKKVWAGGVSGGLWYNNDITDPNSSWNKVNDLWANIAISWIAYDPTDTKILYVATGERDGSEKTDNTGASGSGGGGIWKSTDGGTKWTRLELTNPNYATLDNQASWREIYKVIVTGNGDVLALTLGGIFRSKDKGGKWDFLVGENAPASGTNAFRQVSDMELGSDGILYVAEGSGNHEARILKSTSDKIEAFTAITPPGSFAKGRVEIALAPSTKGNGQVIYAVSATGGVAKANFFLKSKDAGATWTPMKVPVYIALNSTVETPFMGDQGAYDLILGTHDTKPDVLYAAGVAYSISTDGGESWLPTRGYGALGDLMHVDNHAFANRPGKPDEAIFGNDGGVYYAPDWATSGKEYPKLQKRNNNYNVTQYFAVDIAPEKNSGLVVGGTQDNGSHALSSDYNTISSGKEISSGDGGLTFIDKVNADVVISAYTHIEPFLHKKNGTQVDFVMEIKPSFDKKGMFINPADYDSPNRTYYANYTYEGGSTDTLVVRYTIGTDFTTKVSYLRLSEKTPIKVSFLKLGKTAGVMYVGTNDGEVYKASNIPTDGNATVSLTKIMSQESTSVGNVSCIDFGKDENTIIVTKSNYNIKSVFWTTNGGGEWVSKDETSHNLPNIPIRYALINPKDTKQVMLATELGVYSTTDITAANPDWKPNNETLANVRCDMLKYRESDETVIVGTHGRGIFSTQINQNNCATPITATIAGTKEICAGGSTSLTASGGTSYSWSGTNFTSTTNPVSISNAGTYTVTATSGNCTASATVSVSILPSITVSITGNKEICTGGSASLTASGGTSYSWSGPGSFASTTSVVNVLAIGTYTVTATSGNCTASATVSVSVLPSISVTIAGTKEICAGGSTSLTASGGTSYSWSGTNFTSTTNPVSISNAGTYTVTATSGNCTASASVSVAALPSISVAIAGTKEICTGGSTSLTASGGTSYSWSGTNFTSTANPVSISNAGTYTVTATSGNCTASATVSVSVLPSITVSITGNKEICTGGSASLTASGGTSYSWSGPGSFASTTSVVNVLAIGTYTVTATSGNCTASATVSVSVLPSISVTIAGTKEICAGGSTSLTASGGTSYSWSGTNFTSTTNPVSISNAGTYTVTATSGNCTASASVSVAALPSISVAIAGTKEICTGGSTSLTASGGTSYSWSGTNFTSTANPVSISNAGTYTVTATSGNCTASATVSVSVLPSITVSITGNKEICTGGSASLTASGGTSYSWSGPGSFASTTSVVNVLAIGTYTVTATSGNCTASATVSVSVLPSISVTIAGTKEICAGGSTSLTASGGTSYSWSGTNFTSTTNPVSISNAGTYTVTATSGNCTASASVSVAALPSISVAIAGTKEICTGGSTSLTASGGTSYSWSGTNFTSTANPVSISNAGTYTVTATSGNCTASATVSVSVLPSITVSITGNKEICTGGSASLTASGGTSYSWSGPGSFASTTSVVNVLAVGTYTVTATSGNCTASATVSVSVLPSISVTIAGTKEICAGGSTSLAASGGTSYSWSGTNFTSTANPVSISNAGTYTVTATSGNCTASASISVAVLPSISVSVTGTREICAGGSTSLTASGGTSYSWSGTNFTSTANPVSISNAGTYTVTATSGNCTASATVSVAVLPSISVSVTGTKEICTGGSTSLTASGGTSYSWSGTNFTSTANPVSISNAGTYTVTATSGNCTASTTFSVSVLPSISVSVTGTREICAGGSTSLTASGGTSYSWSGTNFTSTTNPVSISNAGTYTVTATSGNCTASATVSVAVLPSISVAATSNSPVTVGNSIQLSASGGSLFAWSGPANFTSTAQNPTLANASVALAGIYTVKATSSLGCTATATTLVAVQSVTKARSGLADLNLVLDVNNVTPSVGNEIRLAVLVQNSGPDLARNVVAKIKLPQGLAFATNSNVAINDQIARVSFPSITSGTYQLAYINLKVTSAKYQTIQAEVEDSDQNDPDSNPNNGIGNGEDDQASFLVKVQGANDTTPDNPISDNPILTPKSGSADLSLLLDVNNRTPKVGSEVQVAVYVKNDGPDASTNAIIKINLPEGFTFTSGNGFTVNGRTVIRKINRIATGQFELSFFKVRVDAANASKVVVSAEVADADQNDPDSTPGNGIANTEDDRAAVDLSIQPSGSRMGDESITESLIVYPNPTKGLLEVQVVLEEPATVELYLTDISGITVVKQTLDTVQKQHKTVLDLSNQIQGVYLLSAVSNKTQLSKRIIRIE
ncbi:MAG: T9SS type A sorting domain-containing protein [Spirosomataceae bacterium]